ncbi:MAG TPA: hypothetical protein VGL61_14495 [Kofleriaceae bacterium]
MKSTWGGARAGAGRPAMHAIASEPHKRRPVVSPRHPVHVVARVVPQLRAFGSRRTWRAVERAVARSLARDDFRIVHVALAHRRLELVVEADDRLALARGMQGFEVSAARALNRALGRRGCVFADRYRPRALPTRAAIRAVLRLRVFAAAPRVAWPATNVLISCLAGHPIRDGT